MNAILNIPFIKKMKIGYKRVSTIDQNVDRQLEGLELDKVFVEYASAKNTKDRPVFKDMIDFIRENDTLYVHSMDRFARSVKDLIDNIHYITKIKKASIVFTSQNMTLNVNDEPMVMLQLHMLAAFYQFELAIIRERAKEGIAIAKAKGKYKGRVPINQEKIDRLYEMVDMGVKQSRILEELQISKATLMKYKKIRLEKESC